MALRVGYEKVICACCFLFIFVNIGIPSTSFNVFQPYIVQVPGVGDTGGSLILAVRTATSMLCMLIVGRYYDLLDVRYGVGIASLLVAAGMLVYGLGSSLPVYFLAAFLTGAGYGLGGMVAMTMLVGRWYQGHVGTAVGVAVTGSGVASVILPLIVTHIIQTISLSAAFLFESAVALVLGIVVFLLIRNRPRDMGLQPYVGKAPKPRGTKAASSEPKRPQVGFAESRPLSPRRRIMFFVAMGCIGAISIGGFGYINILMTSSGYNVYFAATLASVAGLSLTVAKTVSGMVFDALGTRRGSAIFFLLMDVGLCMCCFAESGSHVVMAIGCALYAAGACLGTVGISVWSLELAGPDGRAKMIKNCQLGYLTGGFLFNFIPGPLMEAVGSYAPSYVFLLVGALYATVMVLGTYRKYASA